MDLNALKLFIAVAQQHSFAVTAEKLNVPISALS